MTDRVWIICEDFHTEGLGAPLQAFSNIDDAMACMALLRKSMAAPAFRLFELPVWPNTADAQDAMEGG